MYVRIDYVGQTSRFDNIILLCRDKLKASTVPLSGTKPTTKRLPSLITRKTTKSSKSMVRPKVKEVRYIYTCTCVCVHTYSKSIYSIILYNLLSKVYNCIIFPLRKSVFAMVFIYLSILTLLTL